MRQHIDSDYSSLNVLQVLDKVKANIPAVLSEVIGEYCCVKAGRPLGHYTNSSGLLGIGASRSIFCTNVQYLNDSSEFTYAIERLEEIASSDDPNDPSPSTRAAQLLLAKRLSLASGEPEYVDHGLERLASDYFIACFSENTDQLSQWRGYGSGTGGYCIVFDQTKLQGIIENNGARLMQCIYSESTHIEVLVAFLHDAWKKVIDPALLDRDPPARQSIENAATYFLEVAFAQIASMFKHPSFAEEAEWRLIAQPKYLEQPAEYRKVIRFRASGDFVAPYLEFKLGDRDASWPAGLISSVVVGPSKHPELSRRSVERFTWFSDIGQPTVKVSGIPFRPVS